MNLRTAVSSVIVVCLSTVVLSSPQESSAEPILKPRKYSGPIPKRYFTFDIGILGGADNEEMWDYLAFKSDWEFVRTTSEPRDEAVQDKTVTHRTRGRNENEAVRRGFALLPRFREQFLRGFSGQVDQGHRRDR